MSDAQVSIKETKVRAAKAKFQAYDMLGVPTGFNADVDRTAIIFFDSSNKGIGLNVKDLEFSPTTGTFSFFVPELGVGKYWFDVEATSTKSATSSFVLHSEQAIEVTAGLQFKGLAFEITGDAEPSKDLLEKKKALDVKYPA